MGIRMIEEETFEKLKQLIKDMCEASKLLRPDSSQREWFDNQQVCLLLDISPRTLQSYRDRGVLPFSQVGQKCYYKESDIKKLVQRSKVEAKPMKGQ